MQRISQYAEHQYSYIMFYSTSDLYSQNINYMTSGYIWHQDCIDIKGGMHVTLLFDDIIDIIGVKTEGNYEPD